MLDQSISIIVGKTVIETLTQGMYEDPRFVYREYIQNSADAIDKAVELSILKSRNEGEIYITIEKQEQRIIIEDNGIGIKNPQVLATLGNIALSEKDRTKDKGFRGIGRLGGLGYCDKLIFETSSKGEPVKTVMTWDAFELRQKLFDKDVTEDASGIVKSVVSTDEEEEKPEEHYFRVILEAVDNDELLDLQNINEYLAMVAPVSFSTAFYYKSEIYNYANDIQNRIDEYTVFINSERLYKPYKTVLYEESNKQNNFKKYDDIIDIKFFDCKMNDNSLLAWGWYGISCFEKQIPKRPNFFRGIRLRKGNIEIGDEQTLINRKITREDRANGYFIGEIYCVHPNLIPNSRRDYFNENNELKSLERSLKDLFHNTLHTLYYTASNLRGAYKTVNKANEIFEEIKEKENTGYIDKEEKEELLSKFNTVKQAATEAEKKIQKIENAEQNAGNSAITSVIKQIKAAYKPSIIPINDLPETIGAEKTPIKHITGLNKSENKLVNKIYQIIKQTLTPDLSEPLIKKIDEGLRK